MTGWIVLDSTASTTDAQAGLWAWPGAAEATEWVQSITGPPGADGPPGPPGTGTSAQFAAASPVSALRAVRLNGGQVEHLDSADITQAHECVGVSIQSATTGGTIDVQYNGVLEDSAWNFTKGRPVYVGASGQLTQIPPTTLYALRVGVAVSPTQMFVRIEQPIFLT